MKWKGANQRRSEVDCKDALAATLEAGPGAVPADDAESGVLCKRKIRKGQADDECQGCGKDCPR